MVPSHTTSSEQGGQGKELSVVGSSVFTHTLKHLRVLPVERSVRGLSTLCEEDGASDSGSALWRPPKAPPVRHTLLTLERQILMFLVLWGWWIH